MEIIYVQPISKKRKMELINSSDLGEFSTSKSPMRRRYRLCEEDIAMAKQKIDPKIEHKKNLISTPVKDIDWRTG